SGQRWRTLRRYFDGQQLGSATQPPRLIQLTPVENQVGVDSMCPCYPRYRRALRQRLFHNLPLLFHFPVPPFRCGRLSVCVHHSPSGHYRSCPLGENDFQLRICPGGHPRTVTSQTRPTHSTRHTFHPNRKRPPTFLLVAFDFMPAMTYSPTHFRVQYNRPCGA